MKKLVSKFIIGILALTTLCTGSVSTTMEVHAQSEMLTIASHDMEDESVNCCEDHEGEASFTIQHIKESSDTEIRATAFFLPTSHYNSPNVAINYTIKDPDIPWPNRHLRSVILLE